MSHLNLVLRSLAFGVMAVPVAVAQESPQGGVVVAGNASIASQSGNTTITQTTAQAVLEWQSFDIGASQSVRFIQPDSSAVALNRVLGANPSQILGSLSSNGKVFLVNPNGILFGQGAEVNVGGLVASSRNISNSDFMAGNLQFQGSGTGEIINRGAIDAGSGYVAMLGAKVRNDGVIAARLGSVALAAGNAFTLDVAGDGLLNVAVDAGSVNALVENGGLIRADGGQVLLTARSAGDLLTSAVNHGGIIQAQTVENRAGSIRLLGDMQSGTVQVSGLLDASAPQGGDGGFVDTSAATVSLAPTSRVTTSAAQGETGLWLIDPTDFTIAASGGDMTGAQLSTALAGSNVTISSAAGAAGTNGDIRVNDTVSWSANQLTLNAIRNIDINTAMQGSGTASLALEYGQGAVAAGNAAVVNVRAAVNLASGNHYSTRLGSDGAVVNYTVINDMTALQNINSNLTGNYALGSNLNATGVVGFTPIGPVTNYNATNRYEGNFDGLGHSISNLTISRPSSNFVGLFGAIGGNGHVRNLGLSNVNITGLIDVGGLVGLQFGAVSNSYVTGTVTGHSDVGGLTGYLSVGRVTGSYAAATVSTGPNYDATAGGLVGSSYVGTIRDSHASGTVVGAWVGGITGMNNGGFIYNSYSSAAVNLNTYGNSPGGLVGRDYGNGTVVDSYWNTTTSGRSSSVGGTGLTTSQLQAALPAGFSTDTWGNGGNQTTPYLIGTTAPVLMRADTSNTYYNAVQNIDALQGMSSNLAGNYVLVNNIDAAPTRNWNGGLGFRPVGDLSTPFTGRLNGLGFGIDGLYINRPATSVVGVFGQVSTGRVQSASLTNVAITGSNQVGGWTGHGLLGYFSNLSVTGTVAGNNSVGGLIGYNNTSQVYDSRTAATVTGNQSIGGLIGETNGGVPTARNYATGSVTGLGNYVGGLVGYNGSAYVIVDSYATGSVTGAGSVGGLVGYHHNGAVNTSYSTGLVTGVSGVGGLIGTAGSGTATNSFWNAETSGQASSARGTGLTTAQMQQRSNFNGWNFSSVWVGYNGRTNPLLRSFMTPLTVTAQDVERTYDGLAYSGTPTAVYSLTPDPSRISGTLELNMSGIDAGYSPITVGGLWSDQNGYAINFISGYHIINPYSVSLTGTRVYDGTEDVAAEVFTLGPLLNGDTLTLAGSGLVNRNVGVGHVVDTYSLALQDGTGSANNYTLDGGTHTVDITAADITFGSSDVIRTYDGSLNAAGSVVVLSGTLFNGDLMDGGSFAFTDRNAGSGKTVTTSGVTVDDGNGGANYRVFYADNTTSTITRAQLGATAVAANKIYDGSTLANATLTLSGLVDGETLAVSNSASFNSKDVATANLVTVDSITLADGSGGGLAANYTLTAGQTAAAVITPRALSVAGQSPVSKEYDGTTLANTQFALAGLVDGETLAVSYTASYNSKDVATANLVTIEGITLADGSGGSLAGNYTVATGQTLAGAITPRGLDVLGQSVQTKAYDGTTAATLFGGSLTGVLPGEVVTLTQAGRFTTAEPGNGIAVIASNTIGAADAANYVVVQPSDLAGNINPLAVPEVPVVDVRTAANYQGSVAQASTVTSTAAASYAAERASASPMGTGVAADPYDLAGLNLRVVVVTDEEERRRRGQR